MPRPTRENGLKTTQAHSSYPELFFLQALPGGYRGLVAIVLAVSPPLIVACFATSHDRWDLFQRSGALTGAVGFWWCRGDIRTQHPRAGELSERQRIKHGPTHGRRPYSETGISLLGIRHDHFGMGQVSGVVEFQLPHCLAAMWLLTRGATSFVCATPQSAPRPPAVNTHHKSTTVL